MNYAMLLVGAAIGAALAYAVMPARVPKHLFLAWDPAAGPAGSFTAQIMRPGQRFARIKGPDGGRLAFPILTGWGAGLGKAGSLYMGDIRSKLPVKLKDAEIGQVFRIEPTRQAVSPHAGDMSAALEDTREEKLARAARAVQGGGFPLKWLLIGGGALAFLFFSGVI